MRIAFFCRRREYVASHVDDVGSSSIC
jgi:hypothetical protein